MCEASWPTGGNPCAGKQARASEKGGKDRRGGGLVQAIGTQGSRGESKFEQNDSEKFFREGGSHQAVQKGKGQEGRLRTVRGARQILGGRGGSDRDTSSSPTVTRLPWGENTSAGEGLASRGE